MRDDCSFSLPSELFKSKCEKNKFTLVSLKKTIFYKRKKLLILACTLKSFFASSNHLALTLVGSLPLLTTLQPDTIFKPKCTNKKFLTLNQNHNSF